MCTINARFVRNIFIFIFFLRREKLTRISRLTYGASDNEFVELVAYFVGRFICVCMCEEGEEENFIAIRVITFVYERIRRRRTLGTTNFPPTRLYSLAIGLFGFLWSAREIRRRTVATKITKTERVF